jgi:hypothetical protein
MSEEARNRWAAFAEGCEAQAEDDGFCARVLPLIYAARIDPVIGSLFPFRSLNRLCFAATEAEHKPRHDYPCIDVLPDGTYCVEDRTYRAKVGPPAVLTHVATPEEALAVARVHLKSRLPGA